MTSHTRSAQQDVSFDALIDGRDCTIEFTRVTTWVHDAHYGADADGNRGIAVDFINEDYAEDVVMINDDGDPVAVPELLKAEVDAAVDAYLARVEPEYNDRNEPDYDAIYEDRRDREAEERS